MEAMAVGVPVVAAEIEPTFGQAALYAAPEEVWPLVRALWRDRAAWEARVAGGAFVAARAPARRPSSRASPDRYRLSLGPSRSPRS